MQTLELITGGGNSNYQMLVAVPNSSVTYYFLTDPADECPEGSGLGQTADGYITGYVLDNSSGLPLNNVTIGIGGFINYTNASGFYNFSVIIGSQYLAGIKEGYRTHTALINISFQQQTWHNFSMDPETPAVGVTGTVHGTVYNVLDNSTIENATIYVAGSTDVSDTVGAYNLTVATGTYLLVALAGGYSTYLNNVTINTSNFTLHDIYLNPTQGLLRGKVFRSDTLNVVENATVTAFDVNTLTNASGDYELSLTFGEQIISATKSSYLPDVEVINISSTGVQYLNFTITPVSGTVIGTVLDNASGKSH